jgi:DNA-binding GntR family transcriptional regulator
MERAMRSGAVNAAGSLPIERLTTAERVADALREQLLSGEIAPGAPLRDGELSARAGVSRTTVREALTALAREGLLTHSLHRGMEVARLTTGDVHDIYAARRVLERAGAAHLIARPAVSVAELERAVQAMREAVPARDRRGVVAADMAFHTAVVAALGSRRLRDAMAGALLELRLILSVTDRVYDDLDDQERQHRELLEAFRQRRPDTVAMLDDHLWQAEERVCAAVAAAESGLERGGRGSSRGRGTGGVSGR